MWIVRFLGALLLFLFLVPFTWTFCRLTACVCPRCSSKWRTELLGEWAGEQWKCRSCGKYWEVRA